MRVLMFSRDMRWYGGVVNVVSQLCSNFSGTIQIDSFTVGQRKEGVVRLLKIIVPLADIARLVKQLRSGLHDVYHLNPSLGARALIRDMAFLITLQSFGVRRVMLFFHGWDLRVVTWLDRHDWIRKKFVERLNRVSKIIVLAHGFRETLVGWGVRPDIVLVLSTMFDGDNFKEVERVRSGSVRRLVFLSRLVKEKGVMELIDAFAILAPRYPSLELFCIGDGPAVAAMKSRIEILGLSGCVKFPGYVRGKEKAALLVNADIFVFPSYSEGCPVALLEAMAAGLPVVATSVGGIPDIVAAGVNGILIDSPRPELIADAVATLLDDPSRCHAISERNRKQAWDNYEAGKVTARIESLYREIAEAQQS